MALIGLAGLAGVGQVSAQTDPDSPVVTIAAGRSEYGLGIDNVSFTLTRTGSVDAALTVPVTLSQDDGYLDSSALDRSVTFEASATSADLGINRDEFLATATQSGDLTASVVEGGVFVVGTPSSATVRMVVADPAVTVRIEQTSYRFVEGASGTNVVVLARTAAGLPQPNAGFQVAVSARAVPGGATSGTDYAALSIYVEFASSDFTMDGDAWQARKEVALAIADDTVDEADEMLDVLLEVTPGHPYRLALVEAVGQTVCRQCVVPVTIVDNDGAPLTPATVTIEAGRGEYGLGIDNVSFTLTRTGSVDAALTVPVTLSQADGYLDASTLDRAVTFDANAASVDLALDRGEFLATATQSGDLTASVVAGDGIVGGTPSSATVRMVVANPAVTVRIEQASYRFVESANATNLVVLARTSAGLPQPNSGFGVALSSQEVSGGATSGTDYAALAERVWFAPDDFTRNRDVWQARKKVALAITDDTVDETDETLNVLLEFSPGHPGRAALVEADGQTACGGNCIVPVTIVDNDATVTGVKFLSPGKTYAIGDTIRVRATFSDVVKVVASQTARPYIELDVGGSKKRAYFTRLDGSRSLVFGYTVRRGDRDTDGIAIGANSLTLVDGSSISTAAGPAALVHAAVETDPTRRVDGVPPAVSSATVDGTRLILTYRERLSERSVPEAPGGFAVTAGEAAQTVSALSVRGVEVTLTLAAPVENGQTVTVSYAAPGSNRTGDSAGAAGADPIRDIAGNEAENFDDRAATNTTLPHPELSVADADAMEGATLAFRVTLDRPAPWPVTVDWATADGTAEAGSDYEAVRDTLSFASGETEKTIEVASVDDHEHEETETLTLALTNALGARIAAGRATGRISNTDVIPEAWLARFGRTAADQVLAAVGERLKAPRRPGLEGRIAGVRLDGKRRDWGPAASRATDGDGAAALAQWVGNEPGRDNGNASPRLRSREPTGRDIALGTSFALTGGAEDGESGSVWGKVAVTDFEGRAGNVPLDGRVTTGMVGADYEQGPVTGGLLLSMSRGKGSYGSQGGEIETSLAGAYPYARYAMNERVSVWGVAGFGDGKLRLTPPAGRPSEAGIGLRMAAAGARGTVLESGEDVGFELAVESDALLLRIDSEATTGLTATDSDVSRLRLGLEGSWHGIEAAGGTLAPSVEAGVRNDDGDAETGFGIYVGGALGWRDPERGLAAEVEARGLLTHEDEGFRERGIAGSLSWDPRPSSDVGPSMSLRRSTGASDSGGIEALLGRSALPVLAGNAADGGRSRLAGRLDYGLPMFGGAVIGTPRLGFGMSEDNRDVSLGCRLGAVRNDGRELVLDLEGMRRESRGVYGPEHRIGLRLAMRW